MLEKKHEQFFRILFKIFTYFVLVISIAIVLSLLIGVIPFFRQYSPIAFFTGTDWSPNSGVFGVIPLFLGTLQIVFYSSLVCIPIGLLTAIFLSQYASPRLRSILKPILEILAGIPSIIYGFFAYNFINPLIGNQPYSVLGASIALGIMLVPLVASLSEDVLNSVPSSIGEASYGLGSTKFETITKILIPASLSGIMASFIIAISRAFGETMVVSLAAGQVASMSLNPLNPALTMTGAIIQTTGTDASLSSPEYTVLYAIGLTLFVFTLLMNLLSKWIVSKYKIDYD